MKIPLNDAFTHLTEELAAAWLTHPQDPIPIQPRKVYRYRATIDGNPIRLPDGKFEWKNKNTLIRNISDYLLTTYLRYSNLLTDVPTTHSPNYNRWIEARNTGWHAHELVESLIALGRIQIHKIQISNK